jgi:ABC-type multidrug transport system permease subunit
VIAMTLFPLLYATVLSSLSLLLAVLLFGLRLHSATVPLAFPALALTLFAFLPFGLLLAALTIALKQENVGTNWLVAALSLLGGLYFPIALLPHWLRVAGELQPFTPATALLRNELVGSPLGEPAALCALRIAGFAAVLLPLSAWALGAAVRFAQRRATITEY